MQGTAPFALAGLYRLAHDLVTMSGDQGISAIRQPANAWDVVDIRWLAQNWPCGEGLHGRLGAAVHPALGRDQVHRLHAHFVSESRELLENAGVLKAHGS